jgi:hypothetical protein
VPGKERRRRSSLSYGLMVRRRFGEKWQHSHVAVAYWWMVTTVVSTYSTGRRRARVRLGEIAKKSAGGGIH